MGGYGLMGLISGLVGNVVRAQGAKHQEEAQYWGGLAQSLAAAASNPNLSPDQRLQAQRYMWDTFGKHGGKEGKQIAENMTDFLQQAGQQALVQQIQSQGGKVPMRRAPAPGGGGFGPPTPYLPGAAAATPAPQPPKDRPWPLRALAGVGGGIEEAFTGAPAGNPLRGYPAGAPPPQTFKPTPEQEIEQRKRQFVQAGGEPGPEQTYFALRGEPSAPKAATAASLANQTYESLYADFVAKNGRKPNYAENAALLTKARRTSDTKGMTGKAGQLMQIDAALDEEKKNPGTYTPEQLKDLNASKESLLREPIGVMTLNEMKEDAPLQARAIMEHRGDPNMTNLPRNEKMMVLKILEENKFDVQKSQNDLLAVRTFLRNINSTQQIMMGQAINFTGESLNLISNPKNPGQDLIGELRKIVPRTKYPVVNKAVLQLALNGAFGEQANNLAQQLQSQINDVQLELSAVYMKGNSPTDKALDAAQTTLKGDWNETTLRGAVELARRNLGLRLNSIRNALPQALSPEGQQQFNPQFPGGQGGTSETSPAAPGGGGAGPAGGPPPPAPLPGGTAEDFLKQHPELVKKK